jgi:tetratricopeptide (TPR) repeat protein/predicted Ser/Thr protein kinase
MPDSQTDLDFGQYRIQRLLGRGGMGEVYLARDTALERDVAIKFVSSSTVQDAQARARLLREAQAAARLDHPAICAVHEAGVTSDGRAYIVMPFVDGTPLSELVHHGMPVRDALTICAQIAEALSVAHRHGIVHRDLKPGNVIVSPNGRPRLLDFGLAQSLSVSRAVAEAPTMTVAADAPPSLVGTPSYMSPEQIQRRPIDGRSDLFALGAMLYECLTGRRAFDGATPYESMTSVVHSDPPPPSTIRRELTDRHDALCARLMAKDPSDRFQSADEVVGAIRLLVPDTGRVTPSGPQQFEAAPQSNRRRAAFGAALLAVACAGAFAVWHWTQGAGLPPVPPDADRWYRRGTEALRDGAFQSARIELEQAVRLFPQHALAYARLAEADAELDDTGAAQTHLLRLSSLVPDESRLSSDDQLRVRAVRDILLRNVDSSVAALQELVSRHPRDAGAWVDLGRAQEAAGLRDDASASFQHAIEQDREFAAAYLQLGSVEGRALHLDKALDAFAQALRLYRLASNGEGETEVLLRRAAALDAAGEYKQARIAAERALQLATTSDIVPQQVRAKLTLSSVTAAEGKLSEALDLAGTAVASATAGGLDTVASDGLVDLSATLNDLGRLDESDAQIQRAIQLAESRGARRTAARARLQLAETRRLQGRLQDALSTADGVLPFLRAGHYRRWELTALMIQSRAFNALGDLQRARDMSSSVMSIAQSLKDDSSAALGASGTASAETDLGQYPDALRYRDLAEEIYRHQGDQLSLAYSLTNRAELLIKLGRHDDAQKALAEIDEGIARGVEAYKGRARRATYLKALDAAVGLRCGEALRVAQTLPARQGLPDETARLASAVEAWCDARVNKRSPGKDPLVPADASPTLAADLYFWFADASLLAGDRAAAQERSTKGLAALGAVSNDDIRWRLAAVTAASDGSATSTPAALAADALGRLEGDWKADFNRYISRADLTELRKRAAIR